MCDFLIILHIVPLSVGLTFTPGIGCTTICRDLRTQSCCKMNFVYLSFDLGKCSTFCAVLNDAGWCLELVRMPVRCRNCEWPVSHLAVFAAIRMSDVHVEWSKQGPIPSRILVASLWMSSKAGHIFRENNKCVQGSAVNYSIKEYHWPTVCFSCRGVQAAHLIMTVHTTFYLVVK